MIIRTIINTTFPQSRLYIVLQIVYFSLFQLYEIDEDDESHPRLTITVPRELADGFVNNKKENYKFR